MRLEERNKGAENEIEMKSEDEVQFCAWKKGVANYISEPPS